MLANGDIFHGDHHPVSVVEGRKSRNLLPMVTWDSKTQVGITYTNLKDGGFSVTGTANGYQANIWFAGNYNDWVINDTSKAVASFEAGQKVTATDCNLFWVALDLNGNFSSRGSYGADLGLNQHSATKEVAKDTVMYVIAVRDARVAPDMVLNTVLYPRYGVTDSEVPYEKPGTVTDTIFKPTNLKKSGTELTFEKSYNHQAEVDVAGKSDQVQLSGKNLFSVVTGTTVGITLTKNQDGSYHASGTATQAAFFRHTGIAKNEWLTNPVLVPDGDTMWTFNTRGTITGGNVFMRCRPTSGAFGTFNITSNTSRDYHAKIAVSDVRCMEFCVAAGTTVDIDVYMQIEVGSKFTDFEPYVGGIPSPNPDYPQPIESIKSVELVSRGRNLADESNMVYASYSGGVPVVATWQAGITKSLPFATTSKTAGVAVIVDAKPGESFTAKYHGSLDFVSVSYGVYPTRQDINNTANRITFIDAGANNAKHEATYTATQDCCIVFLWSAKYYQDNLSYFNPGDIMLERGTAAHPYEPYHSTTITIPFDGRSLPDGTADELLLYRDGRRKKIQRLATWQTTQCSVVYTSNGNQYIYGFYMGRVPEWFNPKTSSESILGNSPVMSDRYIGETRIKHGNCYRTWNQIIICDNRFTSVDVANSILAVEKPEFVFKVQEPQIIDLPAGDPLPSWWPTTVIYDQDGNDISAFVKVVE